MNGIPKVAIACQGGGSHAAFAAGVLSELLSPSYVDRFELVGLSGTSGGAICAALAWAGLISGGPEEARKRLLGTTAALARRREPQCAPILAADAARPE